MVTADQRFVDFEHVDGKGRTVITSDGKVIRFAPPQFMGLADVRLPTVTRETPLDEIKVLISHLGPEQQLTALQFLGRENEQSMATVAGAVTVR